MLLLLAAPARRPVYVLGSWLEVHGGNADLRQAELVGAVEIALVGKLVGLDLATLLLGYQLEYLVD